MKMDSEIIRIIHETIKSVWENEIQNDYNNIWFMNEDTLKNALYFHLRNKLESVLAENSLRIFTEFNDAEFSGKGFRPDMVIARVDMDSEAEYWRQAVVDCPVVIELKFKSTFAENKTIYSDYDKLKKYIELLGIGGKVYMATIWECEDHKSAWLPDDAVWAKGKVTELNASLSWNKSKPQFYVVTH